MAHTILLRRGAVADLPSLAVGEPAFTTDTKALYIGSTTGNIQFVGAASGGANPTGTIGLAAVNGSATTWLRSDAAPALSQAIAPTWTGKHIWQPSANATDVLTVKNSAGTATVLAVDTTNQRVGIGTASPDYALHVASTNSGAHINCDSTVNDALWVTGKKGAYIVQDVLGGGYGAWITRNLDEAGSYPLVNIIDSHATNTQAALYVRQNGTGDILQIYDGATAALIVKDAGFVGIGTTTPSAALHVLRTTEQARLGYDASNYASFTVGATSGLTIKPGVDSTGALAVTNAAGTATVLAVDTTNQRVVVGTTGYTYNLEVVGANDISVTSHLVLRQAAGGLYGTQIEIDASALTDGRKWRLLSSAGTAGEGPGKFVISDNGTPRVTVDTAGNFGIGTISPNLKLDVVGNIGTQGAGTYLAFDYTGATNAIVGLAADTNYHLTGSLAGDLAVKAASGQKLLLGTGTTAAVVISAGLVGIGTTSPSAALHVLKTTEQARLGYDVSNYTKFTVNATSGLTLTPGADSTTAFVVEQAGGTDVLVVDTTNKAVTLNTVRIHGFRHATATGFNTFAGDGAGNFTMSPDGGLAALASYNSAFGANALTSNTTGNYITALGAYALYSNTTGYANSGVGLTALYDVTQGFQNTAIGYNTGRGITTGDNNTILGANVTGLAADLTGAVILAAGDGNIRYYSPSAGKTQFRYDASNYVEWTVSSAGVLTMDVVGTAPAIQVCTAASDKVGFFGATPVIQRAKADHSNWASLSDVVTALVELGLFDAA